MRQYYPDDPCGDKSYGETRDYTLDIKTLTSCTGTPTAGTIPTGQNVRNLCPGTPFTLSTSGFTYGTGISYQWQGRADNSGSWTNASTSASLTGPAGFLTDTMAFRLIVSCSN